MDFFNLWESETKYSSLLESRFLGRVFQSTSDDNSSTYEDLSPRSSLSGSPRLDCERFARKVFVGGLAPDITEDEIRESFSRFGSLTVHWPHKAESRSPFPPKGFAFLLFKEEISTQRLMDFCVTYDGKFYVSVSSASMHNKPVQIRPWKLADADFVVDASYPLDTKKTIFVGGVPRTMRAVEVAMQMDRLYGGVCYCGIDVDPDLKYPKGTARVVFSNQRSYMKAISDRFIQLSYDDIKKRVEIKAFVSNDQMCDECHGTRCNGKFAPFFCPDATCLQYYCQQCWNIAHSRPQRHFHTPLVKETKKIQKSFTEATSQIQQMLASIHVLQ